MVRSSCRAAQQMAGACQQCIGPHAICRSTRRSFSVEEPARANALVASIGAGHHGGRDACRLNLQIDHAGFGLASEHRRALEEVKVASELTVGGEQYAYSNNTPIRTIRLIGAQHFST